MRTPRDVHMGDPKFAEVANVSPAVFTEPEPVTTTSGPTWLMLMVMAALTDRANAMMAPKGSVLRIMLNTDV